MMDGVSTMDTGSNGRCSRTERRAIAEVKVADLGLPGGIRPIERPADAAVTKSGTNRFSGSLYDVERNSDWKSTAGPTSSTAIRRPCREQREWGYSIGGPIGKPGGDNKLFFFYSHEYRPRSGRQRSIRVPRCRRRSSGTATSRSRATTTASCPTGSTIRVGAAEGSRSETSTAACFQATACSAASRSIGSTGRAWRS